MEKLNSAIVTLALNIKDIVILMMSVKMVFFVDQTIAQLHLGLALELIVAIIQNLEMKISVQLSILVEKMKEIVIPMKNVRQVLSVILPYVHPS